MGTDLRSSVDNVYGEDSQRVEPSGNDDSLEGSKSGER